MIEKHLAHYLRTIRQIRDKVSDHVYAGRIPSKAKPRFAIMLRRVAGSRSYNLSSEFTAAQPIIEIEVVTRQRGGEYTAWQILHDCRLALNALTAGPVLIGSANDQIQCRGMQVVREATSLPISEGDASAGWIYRHSMDVQITHDQDVAFPLAPT